MGSIPAPSKLFSRVPATVKLSAHSKKEKKIKKFTNRFTNSYKALKVLVSMVLGQKTVPHW